MLLKYMHLKTFKAMHDKNETQHALWLDKNKIMPGRNLLKNRDVAIFLEHPPFS